MKSYRVSRFSYQGGRAAGRGGLSVSGDAALQEALTMAIGISSNGMRRRSRWWHRREAMRTFGVVLRRRDGLPFETLVSEAWAPDAGRASHTVRALLTLMAMSALRSSVPAVTDEAEMTVSPVRKARYTCASAPVAEDIARFCRGELVGHKCYCHRVAGRGSYSRPPM